MHRQLQRHGGDRRLPQSVLGQDCDFPVEILVHDDASTDGSAAHIRAACPPVVLIESANNVGFCIANNRMAERARGEFLLLLNNDAELFPDALRTLHEAAAKPGRPAILGLPQYDAESGELVDIGSLFDPFLNPVPNRDPARGEVGMVIGACLWIPKGLWEKLGGFPPWFHSIAEDAYLCCRARLAGHPVRALPVSGYRHWQGKSFGGSRVANNRLATTFRRRALSERNKTFAMMACYPTSLLVPLFPLHLLLLALEGAALSLLKRDGRLFRQIYAPCFFALWRERRRLLSLRREVQAGKHIGPARFLAAFTWMPRKLGMLLRHGLPEVT
jgi:GT2 family glycosyltransferase